MVKETDVMIAAALLLLAASAPQGGAQLTAFATARVVRGERIDLTAPVPAPDRQISRLQRLRGEPVVLRLVEFQ
jgi:hypothetical protein